MEAQLAKRLGRAKDAADAAAPLDAQQRAEQELYGVPENLKARDLGSGHGRLDVHVRLCCMYPVMSSKWRPCTAYLVWHALLWYSLEMPMWLHEHSGTRIAP